MKVNRILSKSNLSVPKFLSHILGWDNAVYLSVLQEKYMESKGKNGAFKAPFKAIEDEYQLGRRLQNRAREYLVEQMILVVEDGDRKSEGKTYSFNRERMFSTRL